ncbi:MAG: hypothetical protein E5V42_00585 [Mesorhizobium sp.]|nr:MAG: hypothetical protein E5V42_00585 [Mesorhizobium sp.]
MEAPQAEVTPNADTKQRRGKDEKNRLAVAPVDHEADDGVAARADDQHVRVVEQRAHKLDINIHGDVIGFCSAHYWRPLSPSLAIVPLKNL